MSQNDVRHVENLQPGDHACLFYDSEQVRRQTSWSFIEAIWALDRRLVYAGWDVVNGRCEWLEKHSDLVAPALRHGQLEIVSMNDAYMPNGVFDHNAIVDGFRQTINTALKDGFAGCGVIGDMNWATAIDTETMIDYEAGADQLLAETGGIGFCYFPRSGFDPTVISEMEVSHPWIFSERGSVEFCDLVVEPGLDGSIVLRGEIDPSNHRSLVQSLQACAGRREKLTLDLKELSFLDIGGARALLTVGDALRDSGYAVRMTGATPHVNRVLDLMASFVTQDVST